MHHQWSHEHSGWPGRSPWAPLSGGSQMKTKIGEYEFDTHKVVEALEALDELRGDSMRGSRHPKEVNRLDGIVRRALSGKDNG